MADKIQFKRGLKVNLPVLLEGEFGFCTDTQELYIGSNKGNILLKPPKMTSIPNVGNLQASVVGGTGVNLTWNTVTGADGYEISRNGVVVGSTQNTNYLQSALAENTTYTFTVKTVRGAGKSSGATTQAQTTTATPRVYPSTLVTTQGNIFIDYPSAGTFRKSDNHGYTYDRTLTIPNFGRLKFVHAFSNGTVLFFSHTKAYYTEDFITYTESTLQNVNGGAANITTYDNFSVYAYDMRTQKVGDTEILAFGNYTIEAGVQDVNIRVWYTKDFGKTIKEAYRFNTTGRLYTRHVHAVVQNPNDGSFWVCTGDDAVNSHLLRGVYNPANDTWSWNTLGTGLDYKWSQMVFHGNHVYYAWDVPNGGVRRCLISSISTTTAHEQIMTTPNDTMNIVRNSHGEMVVSQGYHGGVDDSDKVWYSADGVNFTEIHIPFPSGQGYNARTTIYDAYRTTSEGKLSAGICRESTTLLRDWEINPRIFLDDAIRNAGFPNAFLPPTP